MKPWITPLLAALLLAAFASCHAGDSEIIARGLQIELVQVERAADGTVQVTWRMKNPNVVPYLVDHAAHKITLGGTLLGTVNDTARLGLPPQSQAERTNPLTPAGPDAAGRVAQLAGQGTATYQVDSTVFLLIVDDDIIKSVLTGTGSVPVTAK